MFCSQSCVGIYYMKRMPPEKRLEAYNNGIAKLTHTQRVELGKNVGKYSRIGYDAGLGLKHKQSKPIDISQVPAWILKGWYN